MQRRQQIHVGGSFDELSHFQIFAKIYVKVAILYEFLNLNIFKNTCRWQLGSL